MLRDASTYGLASLHGARSDARHYTQDQLIDAVDKATALIIKYDDTHGYIKSVDFSSTFPSCALANQVRKRMRLTRTEIGGYAGYLVELRYGVWRGL